MSIFYFTDDLGGSNPNVGRRAYLIAAVMLRPKDPQKREYQDICFKDYPKEEYVCIGNTPSEKVDVYIFKLGDLCSTTQMRFLFQVLNFYYWHFSLKEVHESLFLEEDIDRVILATHEIIKKVQKYGSLMDYYQRAVEVKKQQLKEYEERYNFLKNQQEKGIEVPQSEIDNLKKEIEFLGEAIRKLKEAPHERTLRRVDQLKASLGMYLERVRELNAYLERGKIV